MTKKLFVRLIILFVITGGIFAVKQADTAHARTTCPESAYDNCWVAGTLYAVDPDTCECYCPMNSGVCAEIGNPYGGVDPETCTCWHPPVDPCNDQSFIDGCNFGGGHWNYDLCRCDVW